MWPPVQLHKLTGAICSIIVALQYTVEITLLLALQRLYYSVFFEGKIIYVRFGCIVI